MVASIFGAMAGAQNAYQQQQNAYPPGQITQQTPYLKKEFALHNAERAMWASTGELATVKVGKFVLDDKYVEDKDVDTKSGELLPDISLARVFKWGIVLIIALALGKRVWETFGSKITAKLHKELEAL